MDVVYTWVDGEWPGYAAELAQYAQRPVDANPNRTRDNLELLRFSLRSLERHLTPLGRVFLVTKRPQVPAWLETGEVRVVHHDTFLPNLGVSEPTFSSLAIASCLHHIPGIGAEFLYVEDDRLAVGSVSRETFVTPDGKHRVYTHGEKSPAGESAARQESPWERALAESNRALDRVFGHAPRATVKRAPLFIDTASYAECMETFAREVATTRQNRFRHEGSIAPEHLYPYFMVHRGRATLERAGAKGSPTGYLGLSNAWLYDALALKRELRRQPSFLTLNDNFGPSPSRRAVARATAFLRARFPEPSRFERRRSP